MLFPKSSSLRLPLLFFPRSPLPRWQSPFHSVAFPAMVGLHGRSQRMQQGKRNESKCCCFLSMLLASLPPRVQWDRWALSKMMSPRSRLQSKAVVNEKELLHRLSSLLDDEGSSKHLRACRGLGFRRHQAYRGIVHIQTWSLRTKSRRSMIFTIWDFSEFIFLQVVVSGRSQHG